MTPEMEKLFADVRQEADRRRDEVIKAVLAHKEPKNPKSYLYPGFGDELGKHVS